MAKQELGLYLNSINKTKENVMRNPEADPNVASDYPAFIIRRLLSYQQDSILFANEMNMRPNLDGQLQYEFLLHVLSKRSRFSRLHKVENVEHLDLLKQFYNYSDEKALAVLPLHTAEDLKQIEKDMSEGGTIRDNKFLFQIHL